MIASGADGRLLAADTPKNALVNVAADSAEASSRNVRFEVIDPGTGRAALKTADGHSVSADQENAVLKDLAGKTPGETESFQWINFMRWDTMFMWAKHPRQRELSDKQQAFFESKGTNYGCVSTLEGKQLEDSHAEGLVAVNAVTSLGRRIRARNSLWRSFGIRRRPAG